jgi:hypothetical protein
MHAPNACSPACASRSLTQRTTRAREIDTGGTQAPVESFLAKKRSREPLGFRRSTGKKAKPPTATSMRHSSRPAATLHGATAQMMQTNHRRRPPRSEPAELQRLCEAFRASCVYLPQRAAPLCVLTAFPNTRESAVVSREGEVCFELTPLGLVKASPPCRCEPSGRGAHRGVMVHEANEASLHGTVARDEERWQAQDGPGG